MIEPSLHIRCAQTACLKPAFGGDFASFVRMQKCSTCPTKQRRFSVDRFCVGRSSSDMQKSISTDSCGSVDVQEEVCSPSRPTGGIKTSVQDPVAANMEKASWHPTRNLLWKVRLPDLSALADKLTSSFPYLTVENVQADDTETDRDHPRDNSSALPHPSHLSKEDVLCLAEKIPSSANLDLDARTDFCPDAVGEEADHKDKPEQSGCSTASAHTLTTFTYTPTVNLLTTELPSTPVRVVQEGTGDLGNSLAACFSSLNVYISSPINGPDKYVKPIIEAQPEANRCERLRSVPPRVGQQRGRSACSESDSGGSSDSQGLCDAVEKLEHDLSASPLSLSDVSLDMGISLASMDGADDQENRSTQERPEGSPCPLDETTLLSTVYCNDFPLHAQHNLLRSPQISMFHAKAVHSSSHPGNVQNKPKICNAKSSLPSHQPLRQPNSDIGNDSHLDLTSHCGTDLHPSVEEVRSCATRVDYSKLLARRERRVASCSDFDAFTRILARRPLLSSTPNKNIPCHEQKQRRASDPCPGCGSREHFSSFRKRAVFKSLSGDSKLCDEIRENYSRTERDKRRRGQVFECASSLDVGSVNSTVPSVFPIQTGIDLTASPFKRFSRSCRGFRVRRRVVYNHSLDNFQTATKVLSPLLLDNVSQSHAKNSSHGYTKERDFAASFSREKDEDNSAVSVSNSDSDSSDVAVGGKPKRPTHASCLRTVGSALRRLSSPTKNLCATSLFCSKKCTYDLELASQVYFRSHALTPISFKKRKKSAQSSLQFPPPSSRSCSFPSSPCTSAAPFLCQPQRLSDVPDGVSLRASVSSLSSSTSSWPLLSSRARSVSVDNCVDSHSSSGKHHGTVAQKSHRTLPRGFGAGSGSFSLLESGCDSGAVRLRKVSYEHASYVRCGNTMLLLDAL